MYESLVDSSAINYLRPDSHSHKVNPLDLSDVLASLPSLDSLLSQIPFERLSPTRTCPFSLDRPCLSGHLQHTFAFRRLSRAKGSTRRNDAKTMRRHIGSELESEFNFRHFASMSTS